MYRRVFIMAAVLLCLMPFVYADIKTGPPGRRQTPVEMPALDISGSYGLQYIFYTSPTDGNPNKYTTGLGASGAFSIPTKNRRIRASARLSTEYYNYKDFHSYHNLKLSGNIMYRFFPSDNSSTCRLFVSAGPGADFVFRDDGDFGIYFLGNTGLLFTNKLNNGTDFIAGANSDITLQKGSWLFHLCAVSGIRIRLGD